MTGIIPTPAAGGVETRDSEGVCLNPAGVQNYYCPSATFVSTCDINFLPDGCEAQITPAQINAFQSEMLALAEQWNPDGTWNCGSVTNLADNFLAWASGQYDGSLYSILQARMCDFPTATVEEAEEFLSPSAFLCDGEGNVWTMEGIPVVTAGQVSDLFCDNDDAMDQLNDCSHARPNGFVRHGGDTMTGNLVLNTNTQDPLTIRGRIADDTADIQWLYRTGASPSSSIRNTPQNTLGSGAGSELSFFNEGVDTPGVVGRSAVIAAAGPVVWSAVAPELTVLTREKGDGRYQTIHTVLTNLTVGQVIIGMIASSINDGFYGLDDTDYDLDPTTSNYRHITRNDGGPAFNINAPTVVGDYTMLVQIENETGGTTYGAVTWVGFDIVDGDAITDVAGDAFEVSILKHNNRISATVKAWQ